jgi:hypothetical protein
MAKRKRTNNDLQNITHKTKEHKGPKEDSQNRLGSPMPERGEH